MKKTIAVVALDPRASAFYAREIAELFGTYVETKSYSVRDGSATGKLPRRICSSSLRMPMVQRRWCPNIYR